MQLTVLDGERATMVESSDGISVSIADLPAATGWTLKPQGLCQGDVCVPVRDHSALVDDDTVRLDGFAEALRRPIVLDPIAGVAAIGLAASDVASQLRERRAPDFTLRDLAGREHTMSKIGRKKKVLVVWASW